MLRAAHLLLCLLLSSTHSFTTLVLKCRSPSPPPPSVTAVLYSPNWSAIVGYVRRQQFLLVKECHRGRYRGCGPESTWASREEVCELGKPSHKVTILRVYSSTPPRVSYPEVVHGKHPKWVSSGPSQGWTLEGSKMRPHVEGTPSVTLRSPLL